jgi:hypothetical protein
MPMEVMTVGALSAREGHLDLASEHDRSAEIALGGDLLLLASSWERRCTEVLSANHSHYARAAVVRFAETGSSGRREEHDATLGAFATARADKTFELEKLSSGAFAGWRRALSESICETRAALGRPVDLVADITCLPKYYLLSLLGFAVASGNVRSLQFFYAEGKYAGLGSNEVLSAKHAFTAGDWRSLPVPYLEGEASVDRKVRIIASLGFESFPARKFIRSYEAERHLLITASPGFAPEYEEQSRADARALAANLDLSEEEILRTHAGDAIGTAQLALKVLDSSHRYNDLGLCIGTKPHALGLGIAALLRPHFTLVCRVPEHYVETETPALGLSWVFRITDLSAGLLARTDCADQNSLEDAATAPS